MTNRERIIEAAKALERVTIAARLLREANKLLLVTVQVGMEPVTPPIAAATKQADCAAELLRATIARIPV